MKRKKIVILLAPECIPLYFLKYLYKTQRLNGLLKFVISKIGVYLIDQDLHVLECQLTMQINFPREGGPKG